MKVAAITGEREATLIEAPRPPAKEDYALVKITVAPMCTEYKDFIQGRETDHLGHEAVGEVVDVAQPGKVKVGDRVVVQPQYPCGKCELCVSGNYIHCEHNVDARAFLGCSHGTATMAQFIAKPSWLLSPIPDDISDEHASLALCALGPTFGAFQLTRLTAGESVLITGLGPVGLGGVVNASFRGARVFGVDFNPWRRQRALELGAEAVFDPNDPEVAAQIRARTRNQQGVDVAHDCSGAAQAHKLGLDVLRRKGRFSLNQGFGEAPVGLGHFVWSGHQLFGAWHYNLADFPLLLEVIRRSPHVDHLISHVFPLSRLQEAFETLAGQETAKVLLKVWE
ncbi:MAG TPA: zinc-binding dehydrogenase [Limnochordia bacterium]|nr:zinc-binding dehydrogenase [Limnochordia bacterium]